MISEESDRLLVRAMRFAVIATSDRMITYSICKIRTNDNPSIT